MPNCRLCTEYCTVYSAVHKKYTEIYKIIGERRLMKETQIGFWDATFKQFVITKAKISYPDNETGFLAPGFELIP